MGRTIIALPRLGETMEEAKVTEWLVAPGAAFLRGDVLLEVETDKTVVEVPALLDGILIAQLVAPGETVALDQPIAEVESEGVATVAAPAAPLKDIGAPPTAGWVAPAIPADTPRPAASPAARRMARASGVALTLVPGTGRRGRITAADVAAQLGGRAATVVLLHGLFDQPKGWRDLPARLARMGHAVAVPDLPGHGANSHVETIAEAISALLPLIPSGPLYLVGHSFGAVLATALARRLGPRVERLVLLSPAGLGPRINPDFMLGMLHAETPAALARALSLLDAGPMSEAVLAAELDRLSAGRVGMAALAALAASGGMQQADIAADLAALDCPIAAVFGTADRILDWHDCAALPARAAIHLVRGAGHLPHLAAPELVAGLIVAPVHSAPLAREG